MLYSLFRLRKEVGLLVECYTIKSKRFVLKNFPGERQALEIAVLHLSIVSNCSPVGCLECGQFHNFVPVLEPVSKDMRTIICKKNDNKTKIKKTAQECIPSTRTEHAQC